MWRFLGKQPDELWSGGESPWRSRVDAVLTAFAIHAALQDEAVTTVIEGLTKGESDDEG